MTLMLLQKSNPELANQMMASLTPQFTPGEKEIFEKALQLRNSWMSDTLTKALKSPEAQKGTAVAAKAPAVKKADAMAYVVRAFETKDPKRSEYRARFNKTFPDAAAELDKRLGITAGSPVVGEGVSEGARFGGKTTSFVPTTEQETAELLSSGVPSPADVAKSLFERPSAEQFAEMERQSTMTPGEKLAGMFGASEAQARQGYEPKSDEMKRR
jgi:hypothetical protein